jgi:PncC family amidohydrolase
MDLSAPSRKLGKALRKKKLTLAVAESCTGGLIGGAITGVAGSSDYFQGGVISYDNRIKAQVLGVPQRVLDKHGAVSAQTVVAMARGVRKLMRTDCAIAVSGIAGPGGGTKEKPVGLVYLGIAIRRRAYAFEERFKGNRDDIREQAVKKAFERMIEMLDQPVNSAIVVTIAA